MKADKSLQLRRRQHSFQLFNFFLRDLPSVASTILLGEDFILAVLVALCPGGCSLSTTTAPSSAATSLRRRFTTSDRTIAMFHYNVVELIFLSRCNGQLLFQLRQLRIIIMNN